MAAADPIRRFVIDAGWLIRSANAAPGCLEQEALRAEWLAALAQLGLTEDDAREASRGLYLRAPGAGRRP